MKRTDIKNREEFDKYLAEAIPKLAKLAKEMPDEKVFFAVHRQLEAIKGWTADGKNMTRAQKDKIIMGVQASREMDGFYVEQNLVIALDNYIEAKMPNAPPVN